MESARLRQYDLLGEGAEEMSFGKNLQAVRKMNRLSQEELAEMLDVSLQAVSKWEIGGSLS